jgi:hypothetical protein
LIYFNYQQPGVTQDSDIWKVEKKDGVWQKPESLALLWQILNDQAFLGFPWIILRDSWVVGDLEADHERELEVRS